MNSTATMAAPTNRSLSMVSAGSATIAAAAAAAASAKVDPSTTSFPSLLHKMLCDIDRAAAGSSSSSSSSSDSKSNCNAVANLKRIVCWQSDGKSFKIFSRQKFVDVIMPLYFSRLKYSSWVRQLNAHGFKRSKHDQGIIYHEDFLRDVPELAGTIEKVQGNSKTARAAAQRRNSRLSLVSSSNKKAAVSAAAAAAVVIADEEVEEGGRGRASGAFSPLQDAGLGQVMVEDKLPTTITFDAPSMSLGGHLNAAGINTSMTSSNDEDDNRSLSSCSSSNTLSTFNLGNLIKASAVATEQQQQPRGCGVAGVEGGPAAPTAAPPKKCTDDLIGMMLEGDNECPAFSPSTNTHSLLGLMWDGGGWSSATAARNNSQPSSKPSMMEDPKNLLQASLSSLPSFAPMTDEASEIFMPEAEDGAAKSSPLLSGGCWDQGSETASRQMNRNNKDDKLTTTAMNHHRTNGNDFLFNQSTDVKDQTEWPLQEHHQQQQQQQQPTEEEEEDAPPPLSWFDDLEQFPF